jgi:spore maturation protein CgeB
MAQSKTGIGKRVYQIAACGGFLLSDLHEDLTILFEEDREVSLYRSKEELKEKACYFFESPPGA